MIKRCLLSITLLFVVSCANVNKKENKVVYLEKSHYLTLPEYFLKDCSYPPPPLREEYVKYSLLKKEEVLVDLYLEGVKSIDLCNSRLKKAREYQEEMVKMRREDDQASQRTP